MAYDREGAQGERPEPPAAKPASGAGDLSARVLIAIPAAVYAIFIVVQGGLVFALGIYVLGVVALGELYTLMGRVRPAALAGFLTLAGMIAAALYGEARHVLLALAISFPLTFYLALLRPRREYVSWAVAATMFGALWIGLAMVYAVLLRESPHGDGLIVDVLIATFVGDTFAYFGGRFYGRTKIAPLISPNKTLEGLVAGVVGATAAFWFAGLYQDWLTGPHALLIGLAVALAAPVGDLFESLIKRDLEVKDTGRFFGAHGGVLDRFDAILFTIPTGYLVAQALGYV